MDVDALLAQCLAQFGRLHQITRSIAGQIACLNRKSRDLPELADGADLQH